MNEVHFTPGPWERKHKADICLDTGGENMFSAVYGGAELVAVVCVDDAFGKDDLHAANEALIAAAPDLYAALGEAHTSLMIVSEQALDASKTDPRWTGVYEKLTPHIKAARAALKKAGGES